VVVGAQRSCHFFLMAALVVWRLALRLRDSVAALPEVPPGTEPETAHTQSA